jgi:hypothetical protein
VNDHKHLAGFSKRNIRRYLPPDNPHVRRRIRPRWPKNSLTGVNELSKLSNTNHGQDKNADLSLTYDNIDDKKTYANVVNEPSSQSAECSSCLELSRQNRELKEALEKSSELIITADNLAYATSASTDFEFYVLKEAILDYLEIPYLSLKDGDLKIWFTGKMDRKSGHVISVKLGRMGEKQNE